MLPAIVLRGIASCVTHLYSIFSLQLQVDNLKFIIKSNSSLKQSLLYDKNYSKYLKPFVSKVFKPLAFGEGLGSMSAFGGACPPLADEVLKSNGLLTFVGHSFLKIKELKMCKDVKHHQKNRNAKHAVTICNYCLVFIIRLFKCSIHE